MSGSDWATIWPPLPLRVRARLAVQRRIDHVAIWLVDRHRYRVAIGLWKVTGGWL